MSTDLHMPARPWAPAAAGDRRSQRRLVQRAKPTRIQLREPDGRDGATQTACVRDISPSGIGVIHDGPLEPGQRFTICPGDGRELLCRVVHCRPLRGGYLTGARILGDAASPTPPPSEEEGLAERVRQMMLD